MDLHEFLTAVKLRGKTGDEIRVNMRKISSQFHSLTLVELRRVHRRLRLDLKHLKRVENADAMLAPARKTNLLLKDLVEIRQRNERNLKRVGSSTSGSTKSGLQSVGGNSTQIAA